MSTATNPSALVTRKVPSPLSIKCLVATALSYLAINIFFASESNLLTLNKLSTMSLAFIKAFNLFISTSLFLSWFLGEILATAVSIFPLYQFTKVSNDLLGSVITYPFLIS